MDYVFLPTLIDTDDHQIRQRFIACGVGDCFDAVRSRLKFILRGADPHPENTYMQMLPKSWRAIFEQVNEDFDLLQEQINRMGKLFLLSVDRGLDISQLIEEGSPKSTADFSRLADSLESRLESMSTSADDDSPNNPYRELLGGVQRRSIRKGRKRIGLSDVPDNEIDILKAEKGTAMDVEFAFIPDTLREEAQRIAQMPLGEASWEEARFLVCIRNIAQAHIIGLSLQIDQVRTFPFPEEIDLNTVVEYEQNLWGFIYSQNGRLDRYKQGLIRRDARAHLDIQHILRGRGEMLYEMFDQEDPDPQDAIEVIADSSIDLQTAVKELMSVQDQYYTFPSYNVVADDMPGEVSYDESSQDGITTLTAEIAERLSQRGEQSLLSGQAQKFYYMSIFGRSYEQEVSQSVGVIADNIFGRYPVLFCAPIISHNGESPLLKKIYHSTVRDALLVLYFTGKWHLETFPNLSSQTQRELANAVGVLRCDIQVHHAATQVATSHVEFGIQQDDIVEDWHQRLEDILATDMYELEKVATENNALGNQDMVFFGVIYDCINFVLGRTKDVDGATLMHIQEVYYCSMMRNLEGLTLTEETKKVGRRIVEKFVTL